MKKTFLNILRRYRRAVLIVFDIFVIITSFLLSWVAIQGRANMDVYMPIMIASCVFFVACYEIVYGFVGMYDSLWRYAEVVEFFRLAFSSVAAVAIFTVGTFFLFRVHPIPLSVYFLSATFATSLTLYSRLSYRMYRNTSLKKKGRKARRIMVIGAGEAAATLLYEQNKNPDTNMNIICVVDDAQEKVGRYISGVQIMGTTKEIPELAKQCEIDSIILAIPTLGEEDRRRILTLCSQTKCNLRILPDLRQMMTDGEDLSSRIRDVRVEDLLGRDTVEFSEISHSLLKNKVVVVTGGGGSIGSELCRQIALYEPRQLVIVDIYENSAYFIQQELLREYGGKLCMDVMIASVRDSKKMDALFAHYRPDIVFHAAAHKHVPLMEDSPEEAVKNNVCGTFNVANAAEKYNVSRFVLVSTDKAVNPTNVMGATKRICEMVVQAMAQNSKKTSFVAVRFGNVLGSNGSVLPLFKEQIAGGGPVTVTHPDVMRYFMTIPEAVSLVLEAAGMGTGGEIFVLDMGKPVKILDLAENLIKLAGFLPYDDIDILFTGLRPGEKLYEELSLDEEGMHKTDNKKIFVAAPMWLDKDDFFDRVGVLKEYAYANNGSNLMQTLFEMVPTFRRREGE